MELKKDDMKMTKGVAILFMLFLHLFCRREINGLYETFIIINDAPLIYYLALFCDACVPIYCFASGYGLFVSLSREQEQNILKSLMRIFRLLINYWIVLVLFVAVGFAAGRADLFPGTSVKFILNFFVLSNSYCGAWWFLQTYIILVLLSPLSAGLIKKHKPVFILPISGFIYVLSYIQRIKHVLDFGDNVIIEGLVNALVLVGTSQLPFIIGSIFANERIYSRLSSRLNTIAFKNTVCLTGILGLILVHSLYQSMIVAPFTATAFICFFNLMDKSALMRSVLGFFGEHSTNLWLTHMFFYMTIFPELTFAPRYPVLIFAWLIILCLISSFAINFIYKAVITKINKNNYLSV